MDSWTAHTPTPNLKFEDSPAESFLSTPGEFYPSLFGADSLPSATLNPLDMMSPESLSDRCSPDVDLSALARSTATPAPSTPADSSSPAPEDASEKKPVKKRKSWGQVLPEPKTNLPPRKRAKTEDEKEQRRVERVLRNRRAAQSSRERKRQEVEGLEKRNKELEALLAQVQQQNAALMSELQKHRTTGAMTMTSTPFDALRPTPVTLSHQLFGSKNSHSLTSSEASSLEQLQLLTALPDTTVNPASLSPTLTPVPEADEEDETLATSAAPLADAATTSKVTSPDATQHPAAMLCQDLQCRSAEAPPSGWLAASQQPLHPALALLPLQLLLISTWTALSHCQRPLTQIAMSLKATFSLPPTPAILTTIILLVTNPSPATSSRSTTLSTTTTARSTTSSTRSTRPSDARSPSRRSSTLRLKFLRKILTCSPSLARPLMDATMAALRLVSTEVNAVDRVGDDESTTAAAGGKAQQRQHNGGPSGWLSGAKAPSKEVLLTLLWVLKIEERRLEIRQQITSSSRSGTASVSSKTMAPANNNTGSFVLKVLPKRRLGGELLGFPDGVSLKRRRAE